MPIPHFKKNKDWKDRPITQRKVYSTSPAKKRHTSPSRPTKRRRTRQQGIIKTLLPYGLIATALGILLVMFLFAWYSRNLPNPDKIIEIIIKQKASN